MVKDKRKPFVVRLSDTQKKMLTELASMSDRSVSATIRRAIDAYIEKKRGILY